ncbi:MAG: phenylalanine--tRNA ligase subunit beta, partial [Ferruginibacter sp.]
MTISYNWLREYLPDDAQNIEPHLLADILTRIGLEVESMEEYEVIKGSLNGLIAGEVLTCEKHPDSATLKITTVFTGLDTLQIVCGANNVAPGQKVIVAPAGTRIFPSSGESIMIKNARIRGIESQGMICAEDEAGLGFDHEGIYVLPPTTVIGSAISQLFDTVSDHIFEIGLTPNRIDAMSHTGVARDICAYLSHHTKNQWKAKLPYSHLNLTSTNTPAINIKIENAVACRRYSGVIIRNITVTDSPTWLRQRLKTIGVKAINNIVDITNFILHETGQPLHAFDLHKIAGNTIIVKNVPGDTPFKTLDEKERRLSENDLMICNEQAPMCIAGVYGGMLSGVTGFTKDIFLESAWFNPSVIRKTILRHGLRTDAAIRFEKGTDISNTVSILQRAALLIQQTAGGSIENIIDVYPDPLRKKMVRLRYDYLKKLSGKSYPSAHVEAILQSLDFVILKNTEEGIIVEVPYSKPDINLPADIVEEILRIDGLDNIEIPETISISPAIEKNAAKIALKENVCNALTGAGFFEIFTNSITNSKLFDNNVSDHVKLINSLSSELDIMRPSMLQSGLYAINHNTNRKNHDLRFYEFGKTYAKKNNKYRESYHLCVYASGLKTDSDWKNKSDKT